MDTTAIIGAERFSLAFAEGQRIHDNGAIKRRVVLTVDGNHVDAATIRLDSTRSRDTHVAKWAARFSLDADALADKLTKAALIAVQESQAAEHNGEPVRKGANTGGDIVVANRPSLTPVEAARRNEPYQMTDLGNAERFAARFGADVRYVDGLGWLIWNGKLWREDQHEAVKRASATVRAIYEEAAVCELAPIRNRLVGWAKASESAARIGAIVGPLGQSQPGLAIRADNLDADPHLFNVQNGTLDLRTGELRPHSHADLITKLSAAQFDPTARAPTWRAFLDRIFGNDAGMIEFCQRALGSTLHAAVREHVVHVLYGTGANGKSTLVETWAELLGDYACAAAPRLLIARRGESHPTELADLRGARFVSSIETAEGGSLDEERVKGLTGADRIKARKMRENFYEFKPTFKLFLATNHRPIIRGDDHGIWRRIRLWPFLVQIPDREQDHGLKDKLRAELAGILAWGVRGCLAWQEDGLREPECVGAATQGYRQEQDLLGQWFAESCECDPSYQSAGGPLYKSYSQWCGANGARPLGLWKFSERLQQQPGISREPGRKATYFGVRLTMEAHNDLNSSAQRGAHEG